MFALVATVATSHAMTVRHGFYLGNDLGVNVEVSGKHQDFTTFNGTNPEAIGVKNATITNGRISNITSVGYNFRYTSKVGFGYEAGLYYTKMNLREQYSALIGDDGKPFTVQTPTGTKAIVIDSPKSYLATVDVYLGGLYTFAADNGLSPYIGLGWTKVNGDWHNSYYSGMPGGAGYGQSGKTGVDGHSINIKLGVNFGEHYNLELEHAKYKIHANSFRSFNINGLDADIDRTALNFIVSL